MTSFLSVKIERIKDALGVEGSRGYEKVLIFLILLGEKL